MCATDLQDNWITIPSKTLSSCKDVKNYIKNSMIRTLRYRYPNISESVSDDITKYPNEKSLIDAWDLLLE